MPTGVPNLASKLAKLILARHRRTSPPTFPGARQTAYGRAVKVLLLRLGATRASGRMERQTPLRLAGRESSCPGVAGESGASVSSRATDASASTYDEEPDLTTMLLLVSNPPHPAPFRTSAVVRTNHVNGDSPRCCSVARSRSCRWSGPTICAGSWATCSSWPRCPAGELVMRRSLALKPPVWGVLIDLQQFWYSDIRLGE
jgi:hypothetical protein